MVQGLSEVYSNAFPVDTTKESQYAQRWKAFRLSVAHSLQQGLQHVTKLAKMGGARLPCTPWMLAAGEFPFDERICVSMGKVSAVSGS